MKFVCLSSIIAAGFFVSTDVATASSLKITAVVESISLSLDGFSLSGSDDFWNIGYTPQSKNDPYLVNAPGYIKSLVDEYFSGIPDGSLIARRTPVRSWLISDAEVAYDSVSCSGVFSGVFCDYYAYFEESIYSPGMWMVASDGYSFIREITSSGAQFTTDWAFDSWTNDLGLFSLNDGFSFRLEFSEFTVTPVPVPATLPMAAASIAALGWLARRRRRQATA